MDKKKVLYFGNFKSEVQTIDQEILYSLKQKSEVFPFDIRSFEENDMRKIIEKSKECDIFLFHALIPENNDMILGLIIERLIALLQNVKCKKVLWFMDKIAGNKIKIITGFEPHVDYIFLTDDTWLRRFTSDKLFFLPPASSENIKNGRKKKEFECDIAMCASLYGERIKMYEFLKKKFGKSFKLFDDKFGKDFSSLCKSAKIILCPQYPFDDFFWSDRIYNTLASGGLCLHPRTYGLEEQGFKDGEHYISYRTEQDLFVTIKMLLDKKSNTMRRVISKQGQEFVKGQTYGKRIEVIFDKVNETKSK